FEEVVDIAKKLIPDLKVEIEPGKPPKSKSQPWIFLWPESIWAGSRNIACKQPLRIICRS
ncbi:MAG: hypothetical protein KAR37_18470, partial [Alphaproteobacteria bacterium]|nr:hypothetical protein [Alphaproteobacteria bacterium]